MTRRRVPRRVCLSAAFLAVVAATPAVAQTPFWHAPIVITAGSTADSQRAVAMRDDGGAIVIWSQLGSDAGVWASTRETSGGAFSAPVRLSAPCRPGCLFYGLRVDTDAAGGAVAAWVRSESIPVETSVVQAAVRAPAGGFGPAEDLSDQRAFPAGAPDVAAAPGGRSLVAYDGGDRRVRVRERTPGTSWTAAAVIDDAPLAGVEGPDLAVGAGGHAALTWGSGTCAGRITTAGPSGIWAPATALAAGTCVESPAVGVGPSGGLVVSWKAWDGFSRRLVAARADAGGPLETGTDLGPAALGSGTTSAIQVTSTGDAVIVWADDNGRVHDARRGPGAQTWTSERSAPLGSVIPPALGISDDGVAIGVSGRLPPGAPVAVTRDPGTPWNAPEPVLPPGSDGPAIAVASGGEALAVAAGRGRILVSERSARPGEGVPIPQPAATGVTARDDVPVGVRGLLTVRLAGAAHRLPVVVERRVGPRWSVVARAMVDTEGFGLLNEVTVPVRFMTPGTQRYRVRTGDARTVGPEVRVRVRRAGARQPLPGAPVAIAAGTAGVWVLDTGTGAPGDTTARRLDRVSGRVRETIPVGDDAVAIAVGDRAVWLAGPLGVTRIDAETRAVTRAAIPGGARSVTAASGRVWAAGVCDPTTEPILQICAPGRAEAVDPVTGALLGRAVRLGPAGSADRVEIFGDVMWLHGGATDDYDDSVLASADSSTGALRSGPRTFQGRFGVPFAPAGATRVWILGREAVTTAVPSRVASLPVLLPRHRPVQLVPAGARAWLVQQEPLTPQGRRDEAAAEVIVATGRRTGRVVRLGEAFFPGSVAARDGRALWILRPQEATVTRVPLPR